MKLIDYISDKIFKLYYIKYLTENNNNNIIMLLIILYLLNPTKIFSNIKKYISNLLLIVKQNDNSKNNDNCDNKINIDHSDNSNNIDTKISIDHNLNCDNNLNIADSENNIKSDNKANEVSKINNLNEIKNLFLKKNIKNNIKKSSTDPYKNDKENIDKKYNKIPDNHEFKININNSICSTPIFTLRTFEDLDFYYNIVIHNFDTQKIYNLNMCKDIHKWMTTSYLSNEDLADELIPIYFIFKNKSSAEVYVYEYLKFFVHTNESLIKNGFIQKGNDYLIIKDDIDKLIENNYIKDLLNGEHYINYNLSCNEGTINFLDKFLSLVLISEDQIGNELTMDISNYHENKNTYEYYMKTINSDINMFNTSI